MSDDRDVRLYIYRRFVDAGAPPPAPETADALGISVQEAEEAYRRLAEAHAIILEPGTTEIWMANPLSAKPTPFRVETETGGRWWGSCAWDALGVAAMLDTSAVVTTACPDCQTTLTVVVRNGRIQHAEAIAHFAVPARDWWEDIGFT